MKIRPTLYVGLGTTGTNILNHLRTLNDQEYGEAGLPIFRYISIETDEGNNGETEVDARKEKLSPYEVNTVIHTAIPQDTEPIRKRINSNSTSFDEHLFEWLDERILDIKPGTRAGAGAGNLRMTGRLSLWENWSESVRPSLSKAYYASQHPDHKKEAEKFLNRHFGTIEVDDKKHNVFIVGTLCGGTCSGMLLDIAYYFRHIGNDETNIYGIFTMYNEGLALGGGSSILLANCYASLVELDFYNRPETTYQVTFPNDDEIRDPAAPFHVATFLSATNMADWNCVNPEGFFDTDQLNRMAATDLFARSLGIDALIEADLANAIKRDHQFGKVRNAADGTKTSSFVQYMFSSGVDVAGPHKYSVIKAADVEFIRTLRKKWQKSQPALAVPEPKQLVPSKEEIEKELCKTEDAEPPFMDWLREDIYAIDEADADVKARDCLRALETGGGSKYHDLFEKNYSAYCQQYREKLKKTVGNFEGDLQLFPKLNFLKEVHKHIQAKLEEDNSRPADEIVKEADEIVKEAKDDCTKLVSKKWLFGKGKPEFNLNKFHARMKDEQTRFYRKFTAFFVGETLSNILPEIRKLRQEVQKEINDIEAKLTTVEKLLSESNSFLSESNSSEKGVASALIECVHDDIELDSPEEIERLISLIRKAEPDASQWHVREILRKFFNRSVPHLIHLPEFGFDKDAARRSSPYQEFTPNYKNYRLSFEQQGGNTRLFRYLLATKDDNDLRFKTRAEFEKYFVPHLQILYQMEAGYTVDDIRVADKLKKEYEVAQDRYRKGEDDPIHTHKDSNKFDRDAIEKQTLSNDRVEEIKKDWRALRELILRIRKENWSHFEPVFPEGNLSENGSVDRRNEDLTLPIGVLSVKVVGDTGLLKTFEDKEQEWKQLADSSTHFKGFRDQIREEFRNMLGSLEEPSSLQHHIVDLQKMKKGDALKESEKFYDDYVKLVENHSESSQD